MSIVDLHSVEKIESLAKSRLLWRPGITDGEAGIYFSNSECHWEQLLASMFSGLAHCSLLSHVM
jgi:hypothetical protein